METGTPSKGHHSRLADRATLSKRGEKQGKHLTEHWERGWSEPGSQMDVGPGRGKWMERMF